MLRWFRSVRTAIATASIAALSAGGVWALWVNNAPLTLTLALASEASGAAPPQGRGEPSELTAAVFDGRAGRELAEAAGAGRQIARAEVLDLRESGVEGSAPKRSTLRCR
jgi:hypothetical protein